MLRFNTHSQSPSEVWIPIWLLSSSVDKGTEPQHSFPYQARGWAQTSLSLMRRQHQLGDPLGCQTQLRILFLTRTQSVGWTHPPSPPKGMRKREDPRGGALGTGKQAAYLLPAAGQETRGGGGSQTLAAWEQSPPGHQREAGEARWRAAVPSQ